MYRPVVLYIGLRYIRGRSVDRFGRFVSQFSTIGITLGVMALITILSVMNGFEYELENHILRLIPQGLLTSSEGCLNPKRIPASLLETVNGVTHVSPLTTGDVVLQSAHSVAVGVMLGVNPTDQEPLLDYLIETHQDDLIPTQYRVILGNELATALDVKRGDVVRLMVPSVSQFTPLGRIPSQRLFTVIGTFVANSEVDSYQFIVNQQDASRLMRYPANYITGWRLWLKKPLAVDKLSASLFPSGLRLHDWRERKGELFQAIRMEKNMMSLLLSLIITVSVFNIITSLWLLAIEKKSEVAILQTQGATRCQIMIIFIINGASSGIIGTLLGIGLGILLASNLNFLMPILGGFLHDSELPVVIDSLQVIIIALSTMGIALISTIYPSWRATTICPAEALRYE